MFAALLKKNQLNDLEGAVPILRDCLESAMRNPNMGEKDFRTKVFVEALPRWQAELKNQRR